MTAPVTISQDGSIGVIQLVRPDKFNCLSIEAWKIISTAIKQFEKNTDCASLLICSDGDNFCTGADLEEVKEVRKSEKDLAHFMKVGHDTLKQIENSPLPSIVTVQGLCLAGGLELMLACDICFAGDTARLGDQHAHFGLIPGWGGSQRLPRLVGLRTAMDLFLSAKWLNATEAQQIGLVNYVVRDAELQSAAITYCTKLADRSRAGVAGMKSLARKGMEQPLSDALLMEETEAVRHLMTDNVSEGLAAFEQKRKPNFRT